MLYRKLFFAGFLIVLLLLILFFNPKIVEVKINEKTLQVEVADNPLTRSRGLMYRDTPSPIIFIFSSPAAEGFWMKNVNFPLDVIWINENLEIIGMDKMEPCAAEPCKIYNSPEPIKYALEVEAGFTEKNGIKTGDRIEILNA